MTSILSQFEKVYSKCILPMTVNTLSCTMSRTFFKGLTCDWHAGVVRMAGNKSEGELGKVISGQEHVIMSEQN